MTLLCDRLMVAVIASTAKVQRASSSGPEKRWIPYEEAIIVRKLDRITVDDRLDDNALFSFRKTRTLTKMTATSTAMLHDDGDDGGGRHLDRKQRACGIGR
jgi:hypothetical protein